MTFLYNQNDFTHGEISELAYARSDLVTYRKSASRLRNVVVNPFGVVKRRFGTVYINEIIVNQSNEYMLADFEYSESVSYLIIFTDGKLTIYYNDEVVKIINTNYPASILSDQELKWAQSDNKLIIVHPDFKPTELIKGDGDNTDWTFKDISFRFVPSYDFKRNYDEITFTLASTDIDDGISLTTSSSLFSEEYVGGRFEGLGKEIAGEPFGDGIGRIVEYVSDTEVKIDILQGFNSKYTSGLSGKNCLLTEPVWSDAKGYPISTTFHGSRLWFGGVKSLPSAIFGSVTNEPDNFDSGTAEPSDGVIRLIASDKINHIQNIVSASNLQIFTLSSEYAVFTKNRSAITPDDASCLRQSSEGSNSLITPIFLDNQTFYIGRHTKQLVTFVYDGSGQSYDSIPISILSTDLIKNTISMDIFKGSPTDPFKYLFLINESGNLVVYQSFLAEKVSAFSLSNTDEITTSKFKRVKRVGDNVYFIVERDIEGQTKTYLEKLDWNVYTDCSFVRNFDVATTIIPGLDYLEGLRVQIIGDNYVMDEKIVEGGEITLENSVLSVVVGLKYVPLIRTIPVSVELNQGSNKYLNKRIVEVYVDYYKSVGIYVQDQLIPFRRFGLDFPYPASLGESGIYKLPNFKNQEPRNYIEITQKDPLPMTIRGIGFKINSPSV